MKRREFVDVAWLKRQQRQRRLAGLKEYWRTFRSRTGRNPGSTACRYRLRLPSGEAACRSRMAGDRNYGAATVACSTWGS